MFRIELPKECVDAIQKAINYRIWWLNQRVTDPNGWYKGSPEWQKQQWNDELSALELANSGFRTQTCKEFNEEES